MTSWVQCHSSAAHTGIPVCHQAVWLIGNATDTGVPEEEEEEFPAQVAGSKLRDVFIALPGIRASVRRNTGSTWLSST